jgi:hypothetical protein
MSHLTELAAKCAVTLQKSDNMRVTASKHVCTAVAYLKTDAGVMEAHEAGVDPNLPGFHQLVVSATAERTDPETNTTTRVPILLGGNVFSSYRSFQRLLQIKGDPDTDAELRREQAKADKTRRAATSSTNPLDDVLLQTTPDAGAPLGNTEWIKFQIAAWWTSADAAQRSELVDWVIDLVPTAEEPAKVEEAKAEEPTADEFTAPGEWKAEAPALCTCPRYGQPHAPQPACARPTVGLAA